jgi:hypothetical protein
VVSTKRINNLSKTEYRAQESVGTKKAHYAGKQLVSKQRNIDLR